MSTHAQTERQLLDVERKLWTNDAVFYENTFAEEALLVFPETGVITRQVAVDAIREENAEGRRWAEVRFDDVRFLRVADDTQLLTYKVVARWEGESTNTTALASTVYVRRGSAWKVVFHQQTPIPR